jgi:hypothetical protein
MTKKITSESFSDSFWSNSSKPDFLSNSSSLSLNRKRNNQSKQDLLYAVDESPDFHDPYSDLSLFLSGSIKKEMNENKNGSRWTIKIQEDLLHKITPEFQKRFPQYRLGVEAVKKIWKKIVFYSEQIKEKNGAIDANGKININFFIQENLRQYIQQKAVSFLSPYQCAHQIASKVSECIATLDGTKPKLDLLTQTIWSLQKHLLATPSSQGSKAPYDEFDKIDKLIVKTVLETTAKHPFIGMNELEQSTKESLQALHDLPDFSSTEKITCNVSAILAEKLYATSSFHFQFFAEQKSAIQGFISRHSSLYKNSVLTPKLPDLVRRIIALYALASQLPKTIDPSTLEEAVFAIHTGSIARPHLPQQVYAFISAELRLFQSDFSLESMQKAVLEAYKEACLLPLFSSTDKELLEMIIWKFLSETEGFLQKLPYRIGQKIEEEIANILIDDPSKTFSAIVHETIQFFKKVKELTETKKWNEADKKIHLWCIQNDMLCRSIRLNIDSPLGKIIRTSFVEKSSESISHSSFISEVCQTYLKAFPSTTIYMAQLSSRAWILYKYMWFTCFSTSEETSFDRFLKWHTCFLRQKTLSEEDLLKQLEEICKKCLPLIPFEPQKALRAIQSPIHL